MIWPEARMITWRFALCAKDKTDKTGIEECQQDEWVTAWRPEWAGLPAVIQAVVRDDSGSETVVTAVVVQDIGAIILK